MTKNMIALTDYKASHCFEYTNFFALRFDPKK
jgi:hypothetical protein